MKLLHWNYYFLSHLEIVKDLKNEIITVKSPPIIILFELDYNIKFPLLSLLQFLSDLKRTNFSVKTTFISIFQDN